MDNKQLYEILVTYKSKGFVYVTSECNDNYTGYNQAVSDFCEGLGDHEPTYMDWANTYLSVNDFVMFHDGYLVSGSKSTGKTEIGKQFIDKKTSEIDLIAFAIWNLDFESDGHLINSFSELERHYSKMNGFKVILDYSETYIFRFLNQELWSDVDFLMNYFQSDLANGHKYSTGKRDRFVFDHIDIKLKGDDQFIKMVIDAQPRLSKFYSKE